ncbi:hypothetical protein FEK35_11815 [Nocardia cyriacigeorgica]|uniref:Uncharacterized protein n=1 Tax=Nocardia cyriacigeorgica TaxID=135487 RepID=A0A5R8PFL9_9NOCA|nr:hypothetical protein [Nocardia cyriacigeorgica]TLG12185.1 hypothetical protein FEK35_11815 [Nocardia cyriacigeorgica]
MTDQHPTSRLPGLARLFALVVLLGGIVGMHVGVFDFGHAWGGVQHGAHSVGGDLHATAPATHSAASDPHAVGTASPAVVTESAVFDRHAVAPAHSVATTPHAVVSAPHPVVTDAAPRAFPAAGAENPLPSAQSVADSSVREDRPDSGSLALTHRPDTDLHTGTERSGSGVLAQPDRSEPGLPNRAERPESDLIAATFAPPLLSLDGMGGHEQDCGDCGVHGGMHGCVFILSMLGLAIGLVLLFRLAFQPLDSQGTPGRNRPARRERPPPWTMPTLSELSILRI